MSFTEAMRANMQRDRQATRELRDWFELQHDAGMAYAMSTRLERLCAAQEYLERRRAR